MCTLGKKECILERPLASFKKEQGLPIHKIRWKPLFFCFVELREASEIMQSSNSQPEVQGKLKRWVRSGDGPYFFFTQEDLTVKVLINIDLIQCYFSGNPSEVQRCQSICMSNVIQLIQGRTKSLFPPLLSKDTSLICHKCCSNYDSTCQVFSMSLVKKNWYASPIKAS